MKSTVLTLSLCALGTGCASASTLAPQEAMASDSPVVLAEEPQTIRVHPRWVTTDRGSDNWAPAQWEYYLKVAPTASGETAIDVCSIRKYTGRRVPRDSCSRNNQIRLTASFEEASERIVLHAIARQISEGRLDLRARPLFVDVTQATIEALGIGAVPGYSANSKP